MQKQIWLFFIRVARLYTAWLQRVEGVGYKKYKKKQIIQRYTHRNTISLSNKK